MSKRKRYIVGSVSATAVIASLLLTQSGNYVHLAEAMQQDNEEGNKGTEEVIQNVPQYTEEEIGSIKLSPGLYVPQQEELRNQPAEYDDVVKTMNLEATKLAMYAALAELDAGIETHLGFKEEQLNPIQVQFYEENVAHYSKIVEVAGTDSLEEEAVNEALAEFKTWASEYREAIVVAIEDAQREEEEKLKLAESQDEVVVQVDHSPKPSTANIQKVSYGIPELGDQYLTYEPYTAITAKTTPHYRLQTLATTDEHGYRIYEDAVCVALASAYGTTIGTLYDITFADGKVMRAILGDNKSDKHTDELHQYRDATGAYNGKSGNIVEIIFDTKNYAGVNAVNRKINGDYSAKVVGIVKVGIAEGFGQ